MGAPFRVHLLGDSEEMLAPDIEQEPDAFDLFRSQAALRGALGNNRLAANIGERSQEIDTEFAAKIAAGRASIEAASGTTIAKGVNHGAHGVTREYNPVTRTAKVTTIDANGCRMHVEEDCDE